MATLTLREVKGSPLTFTEMDGNLTNLNDDKQEHKYHQRLEEP